MQKLGWRASDTRELSFQGVRVPEGNLLGERGAGLKQFLQILDGGRISVAAMGVGVAQGCYDLASAYAKERVQFGKPIGSFQAVKHHCANMAIAVEASRAAVRGAANALDGDPRNWSTTASVTSSYVGPACAEACALALRIYGGIGFTWEHESHLYLKRVKLDELMFGTPSWHRRRLACTLIERVHTDRVGEREELTRP
jgi:butyryl-CoA dehydrogenase